MRKNRALCALFVLLLCLSPVTTANPVSRAQTTETLIIGQPVQGALTATARTVDYLLTGAGGETIILQTVPTPDSTLGGLTTTISDVQGNLIADSTLVALFGRPGVLLAAVLPDAGTYRITVGLAQANPDEGIFTLVALIATPLVFGTAIDSIATNAAPDARIIYDQVWLLPARDEAESTISLTRTGELTAGTYAPALTVFAVDLGGTLVPEAYAGGGAIRESRLILLPALSARIAVVGELDFGGYGTGEPSRSSYTLRID